MPLIKAEINVTVTVIASLILGRPLSILGGVWGKSKNSSYVTMYYMQSWGEKGCHNNSLSCTRVASIVLSSKTHLVGPTTIALGRVWENPRTLSMYVYTLDRGIIIPVCHEVRKEKFSMLIILLPASQPPVENAWQQIHVCTSTYIIMWKMYVPHL